MIWYATVLAKSIAVDACEGWYLEIQGDALRSLRGCYDAEKVVVFLTACKEKAEQVNGDHKRRRIK